LTLADDGESGPYSLDVRRQHTTLADDGEGGPHSLDVRC